MTNESQKTFIGLVTVLAAPIILSLYLALLFGAGWLVVALAKVLLKAVGF